MNNQPIEKPVKPSDMAIETRTIDVHSIFYTIQGEGPFVGAPAVFVRLAGCNLQCPFCDTDYTSHRRPMDIREFEREVLDAFRASAADLVVITGGEPFRQDITYHVWALLDTGLRVQIETNGTLYLPDFPYDKVTVVCSPKAGKINPQLAPHITALKYVLRAGETEDDGLPTFALAHAAYPRVARPPRHFDGTVYVQPCDESNSPLPSGHASLMANTDSYRRNLAAAIDSAMTHGYTLGVQLHKIIGKD